MVFYRKYRPQTLDDLVGQTSVKQSLKSAFVADKLAHAYLFYGPRGTGKTSTARILAKMVNCEAGKEKSPCNECKDCLAITEGSHLDIVEMDAASNRGIDDIRALRETIKLAPSSAKKKVYIIDEVHMLSGDAFNALLKTLEEPPAHVLFILATTEVQKVPQTILSRVQRLDFKPATTDELLEALTKIVQAEKMDIDKDALLLLAQKANGSFRDGIKLLDQVSSLGKIDLAAVENSLGLGAFDGLITILKDIAQKQAKEALAEVIMYSKSGVNIKELTLSSLDILRQLLLIKNDLGEQLVKTEISNEKYQVLQEVAKSYDLEHLLFTIDCFQNSLEQSRYVSIPSLPLELAVAESALGPKPQGAVTTQIVEKIQVVEKVVEVAKPMGEEKKSETKVEAEKADKQVEPAKPETPGEDIKKIQDKWSYVLETVKQYNYSLEALLKQAKIAECSEKGVVLEVPYSFHQRILEAPKSRDLLESILSDILGRTVKVSAKLGARPIKKEDVANVEVAADDEIISLAAEIFSH